jgi:hypothetical protein
MSWKLNGLLLLGLILSIITITILPSILIEVRWFAISLLIIGGLSAIWFVYQWGDVVREKKLMIREQRKFEAAKRLEAEYKAHQAKYQTKKDGHGMLHLLDVTTGHSQNLTIDSRSYRNGHYEEPKPSEQHNYALIMAKSHKQLVAGQLVIEQKQELDLLSIFTQPTQSYAIIGGQQVGKTFQARRIAQHWLQSGYIPIVIGPKWDKGEWQGCKLYGGEYDFPKVSQGMQIIRTEAQSRHADKDLSHKQHAILPVFFDDWTGIRAKLEKEAEDFVIEATTLYASVNIILYFIIHLDTANAWGVGKIGAALHRNFIKLMIEPGFNEVGLIDRSRNAGFIIYPGKTIKDKVQVRLFGGNGQMLMLPELVPNKQNEDSQFVELVQSGLSRNKAALEAYGRVYAGDLVERGKRALGEL